MSSDTAIIETSLSIDGSMSSANANLNDLYSNFDDALSPSNLSRSSSDGSPKDVQHARTSITPLDTSPNKISRTQSESANPRKDAAGAVKLPYPVLADHRDPSSILIVLQRETQTTSKKITDVTKQIEECEQRLTSTRLSDSEKKSGKNERVKFKQQLDALKKHERRVNLQIDFMTTKTEIKGLEDEQKQTSANATNSDECQQIKILLGKLKQKLDKMKIYMRTRNEQMKKLANGKQRAAAAAPLTKEMNRKRPAAPAANSTHTNKRLKPIGNNHHKAPAVRLAGHNSKLHSTRTPIVRFINKTTDSTTTNINSASPTTPASSSSTLSPPLVASTSTGYANHPSHTVAVQKKISLVDDDDDDEPDLELDMDDLFNDDNEDDLCSQRLKGQTNDLTRPLKIKQDR